MFQKANFFFKLCNHCISDFVHLKLSSKVVDSIFAKLVTN